MPKFVMLNRSMVPHIGLYYTILSITGELGWLLASSTENETIGIYMSKITFLSPHDSLAMNMFIFLIFHKV